MYEINDEELILYEESKEIKETVWKIWDIINDKKIIKTLLLNTSLVKDLKAAYTQNNIFLDNIDNTKENKNEEKKEIILLNKSEEDGKSYI